MWDTSNGALRATLRGGSHNVILSCDISGGVVVGAGSDKTCRVWNLRTQRMVRTCIAPLVFCSFSFANLSIISFFHLTFCSDPTFLPSLVDSSTRGTFPKNYLCQALRIRKGCHYRIGRSFYESLGYFETDVPSNYDITT